MNFLKSLFQKDDSIKLPYEERPRLESEIQPFNSEAKKRTISEIDKRNYEYNQELQNRLPIPASSSNDPFMKVIEIRNIAGDLFIKNIIKYTIILLILFVIMLIVNDVILYHFFIKKNFHQK